MMNEVIDSPTFHANAEIPPVRIANPSFSAAKDTADATEQMLVMAAKLGEAAAFVTLCNRHSDKILRRLYRITKNWEDAEDALQDSFLKAFVHLNKFEGRSSFSSWLTRIAINSALMLLRRKRARNEVSMEIPGDAEHAPQPRDIIDPSETPEHRYAQCESRERLDNAIPRLRPCFRTVVELHHFHEQSAAQIAETLNISVPAVKSRLLRAKSALRKSIVRNQVARALPPTKARDSRSNGTHADQRRNPPPSYASFHRVEAQL
jgi:RNA polymerase sigma-70 factor (ECF subfamily)